MSFPETRLVDWVRDDLADLLWPAALIAWNGDDGLRSFTRLQKRVRDALSEHGRSSDELTLDGRLTSLEATSRGLRSELRDVVKAAVTETRTLPGPLLAALRLYDNLPGAWLLLDPWEDMDPGVPPETALEFLILTIVQVAGDRHKEALLKSGPMAWDILCGQITMDESMADVLKKYPGDAATLGLADTMIRASFGARKGADYQNNEDLEAKHQAWAQAFWRQNWELSPCILDEDVEPSASDLGITGDRDDGAEDAERAVTEVTTQFNRFLEGFFDVGASNLYDPAQHEVISGLVSRAARALIAVLRAPHLWSGEHGSSATRLLAETEINLVWLDLNAPESYAQYQAYGRGKAKLMKRHMQDLAASFEEGAPSMLSDAVDHLERKLGGDWGEQFVPVSVDSTFAGKTVRAMAEEADLADMFTGKPLESPARRYRTVTGRLLYIDEYIDVLSA